MISIVASWWSIYWSVFVMLSRKSIFSKSVNNWTKFNFLNFFFSKFEIGEVLHAVVVLLLENPDLLIEEEGENEKNHDNGAKTEETLKWKKRLLSENWTGFLSFCGLNRFCFFKKKNR